MATSSRVDASAKRAPSLRTSGSLQTRRSSDRRLSSDRQLYRWGGIAGLAGGILLLGAGAVVGVLGLPDASDPETLIDFANIESGRIAEHLFYLGALMLFALHVSVLHRLLVPAHQAAALFGTVMAGFGLIMMAASSLLHVATSPLADLYTAPETPPEDLAAIEYAWHGAQSVFDTLLATGVLLVPIGIVLFGVAMRSAPAFGSLLTAVTIGLGIVGTICAVVAVVEAGSMLSAISVLAIVAFHLSAGWRTWKLGAKANIDFAETAT